MSDGKDFENRIALILRFAGNIQSIQKDVKPQISHTDFEIDVLIQFADRRALIVECKDSEYSGYPSKEQILKLAENCKTYQVFHQNEQVFGLFVVSSRDKDDFLVLRQFAESRGVGFWSATEISFAEKCLSSEQMNQFLFSRLKPLVPVAVASLTQIVSSEVPNMPSQMETSFLVPKEKSKGGWRNIVSKGFKVATEGVIIAGKAIKEQHDKNVARERTKAKKTKKPVRRRRKRSQSPQVIIIKPT